MCLLSEIHRLPDDIIIKILSYIDEIYIREVFLYFPSTRDLVKSYFYSSELHFIVTPLRRQEHFCINGNTHSDLIDFNFYGECEEFLAHNPDLVPNSVLVSTGPDFNSLVDLLKKFHQWFMKVPHLEIILDSCPMAKENLDYILQFSNLSRLELTSFKIKNFKSVLNANFPHLPNLKTLQYLDHDVTDWSGYVLPPNVESLDFSWNDSTDIETLDLQDSITDLYLNYCSIDNAKFDNFNFPHNLKVLMMTSNSYITSIPVDKLPRTLEKLDLAANKIESFTADSTLKWPSNLQEVNLRYNRISDTSLQQIRNIGWPPNLRILQLGENFIKNIYLLDTLPDSVQILDLFSNSIKFSSMTHKLNEFRFPSSLKQLLFKFNNGLLRDVDDNSGRLIFPESLEEIDMSFCALDSLKFFQFPKKIKRINLGINFIENLLEYESTNIKWTDMEDLAELSLNQNRIKDLDGLQFPSNLRHLNLNLNQLESLSKSCALFSEDNKHQRLLTLDLSFNMLKTIGNISLPPTSLSLELDFNSLGPKFYLSSALLAVYSLEISGNDIEELTYEEAKEPLPLRYLMLDKNNLGNNSSRQKLNETYDVLEKALGRLIKQRKLFTNRLTFY